MKKLSTIHYSTIFLFLISLLMQYVYFAETGTFNSPIIEYEFVKNENDVKNIFMENNEFKKDVIKGVYNQNLVDYAYMIAYTLFLILVFIKITKIEKKKIFKIGIILSFIVIVADILENIQLFMISELLVARLNFTSYIEILNISTWIKWLSLALILFLMSFHYFKNKFIGKIFSLLTTLPIILGLLTIFVFKKDTELLFSNSVMIGFILIIIWTYISKLLNKNVSFFKK